MNFSKSALVPFYPVLLILMPEVMRTSYRRAQISSDWAMSVSKNTFIDRMGRGRDGEDFSHRLLRYKVVEKAIESFMPSLHCRKAIGLSEQLFRSSSLEHTGFLQKTTPAAQ